MNVGELLRTHWDRVAAIGFLVAAVLSLLAGWVSLSRTPYVAEQLSYLLSGGIGAIILLGVGGTLWLSADLRDEWRELDSINEALRDMAATGLVRSRESDLPGEIDTPNVDLVARGVMR